MSFTELFSLALGAILMENFVLVKFLGCCPFLGVSKKTETAVGMGMAVIFVMTVASAATYLVNEYVLLRFDLEYMQTVAFILVIAALVQLVSMAFLPPWALLWLSCCSPLSGSGWSSPSALLLLKASLSR